MRLSPIITLPPQCALIVGALVMAMVMTGSAVGCRSLNSPTDLSSLDKSNASRDGDADKTDTAAQAAAAVASATESSPSDQPNGADEQPHVASAAAPTNDAEADAVLVLLEDKWSLEPTAAPGLPRAPYRWRHAGLDEITAAPTDKRVDLAKFLASDDPVVGANAAILLARSQDSAADLQLVETVRDTALKLQLRCAAAEALGRPDSVLASIALAELLSDFGAEATADYSPELHAELLRSLGRQVDAADSPQLFAGLKSKAGEVREAAVDCFAMTGEGELPREVIALRADPNPQVRAAVLNCLVHRHYPQAQEYCLAALGDVHLNVQLAGVAGLGVIGGESSCRALGRLAAHDSEEVRAAAVAALTAVGDESAVFVSAKDQSWHVRRNVARGLARFPSERGAGVARQLLADANAEVRSAVTEAVGYWPLPLAGPILLTAMSDAPEPTRHQAAQQLTNLWPAAERFSPDAPADLRQDQIRQLQTALAGDEGGSPVANRE